MNLRDKRIIAVAIDTYIYIILLKYSRYIFNMIPFIENDIVRLFVSIIWMLLLVFSYSSKDIIFGYESIGKKLMKLQICYEDGTQVKDKRLLFERVFYSLTSLSNLYLIDIIYDEKSVGDKKTKTIVKEK